MATEPGNIGTELEDTERADAFEAQIDAYLEHRSEAGHRRYVVPLDAEPRRVVEATLAARYKDAGWEAVAWATVVTGKADGPTRPVSDMTLTADRGCLHECEACK